MSLNLRPPKEMKMASNAVVMWRERPPGPEQRELDRILSCKEFDISATPDSVRKTNEMFQKFSAPVFAAHFRKTKAKLGMFGIFCYKIFLNSV